MTGHRLLSLVVLPQQPSPAATASPQTAVGTSRIQANHSSLIIIHPASENRYSYPLYAPDFMQAANSKKGRSSEMTLRWEVISLQHLSAMSSTSSVRDQSREVLASSLCVVSKSSRGQETSEKVILKVSLSVSPSYQLLTATTNSANGNSQSHGLSTAPSLTNITKSHLKVLTDEL